MPDQLPLYSPTSACPKCWSTETNRTEYCQLKGYMVRICQRCGAVRNERPWDQATEAEVVAPKNSGRIP